MEIIKREDTGEYLRSIQIGYSPEIRPVIFTKDKTRAIQFRDWEEAITTINFISEIIDWELEEHLTTEKA